MKNKKKLINNIVMHWNLHQILQQSKNIIIWKCFVAWFRSIMAIILFVCLFAFWDFFSPLENFSLIWRHHHYRWKAAIFLLCLALMTIWQWGFFCLPHLIVTRGIRLKWSSPRIRDTHTYCRIMNLSAIFNPVRSFIICHVVVLILFM